MRVAIAADHNGVVLKARLADRLLAAGHMVDDRGAHDADNIVDYPVLCQDLCRQVVDGAAERGVVIGGSGSGEHMACNKIAGVRAGLALERFTCEISRAHNDANVLVIGAKVLTSEQAEELLDLWLATPFKGGRHQQRVDQIAALERGDDLRAT
jgi:ribose 5-phosphate isomerase B